MDYRITADERTRFKRCRRQWDYASPNRRDLEPAKAAEISLSNAIKDALAVYYYPGTWGWQPQIVLPLVHKAFRRPMQDQPDLDESAAELVEAGAQLLEQYLAWAPTLDGFAPIKIDHDVKGLLPDPRDIDRGLLSTDDRPAVYTCRIDLLAIDAADEYWVVRHQLVSEWQDPEQLALDEEAVAACWAWEQEYLGMEIAGTIHNEISRTVGADEMAPVEPAAEPRSPPPVAQHDASGGGRSVPQHRRLYARSRLVGQAQRVEQCSAGPIRRTQIRRGRTEIEAVGRQIGEEALAMLDQRLATYPTPGPHCRSCQFLAPCLVVAEGADPTAVLAERYRRRLAADPSKPRLGQSTWSVGRGAAPPQW